MYSGSCGKIQYVVAHWLEMLWLIGVGEVVAHW